MGLKGQEVLSRARVAVIGVGGLGAPCSLYLAGAGIGNLLLMDGDRIEISNLHRQVIFTEADVGQNKATVAKQKLTALNSEIQVASRPQYMDRNNIEKSLSSYDVVVDGTDNFQARFLLNEFCVARKKIFIYGSATQWYGQAALFYPEGPCLCCLFSNIEAGLFQDCDTAGILGPAVGVIALFQAQLVLNWFLFGKKENTLYLYDAKRFSLERIMSQKLDHCPVCSRPCGERPGGRALHADHTVSLRTALRWQKEKTAILDLRDEAAFREGVVSGAIHLPYQKILFEDALEKNFKKGDRLVLYCHNNVISPFVQSVMAKRGYRNIYVLDRRIK